MSDTALKQKRLQLEDPLNLVEILRFDSKVAKTSNHDDCWLWQAAQMGSGYGQFGIKGHGTYKSHRVCWFIHNGPIPPKRVVRHSCDNPPCCNPNHLILGSQQDNMDDKIRRGRSAPPEAHSMPGEKHPRHRLTDENIREIRRIHATNRRGYRATADIFGVTPAMICHILNGRAWNHL